MPGGVNRAPPEPGEGPGPQAGTLKNISSENLRQLHYFLNPFCFCSLGGGGSLSLLLILQPVLRGKLVNLRDSGLIKREAIGEF